MYETKVSVDRSGRRKEMVRWPQVDERRQSEGRRFGDPVSTLVEEKPSMQNDDCPFLIMGDKSAAECITNGHCGCGAAEEPKLSMSMFASREDYEQALQGAVDREVDRVFAQHASFYPAPTLLGEEK